MGLFRKKIESTDEVIDLVEPKPSTAGEPAAGLPGPCPRCGGPGYLDHIDLVSRVQRQHCRVCANSWEESLDDEDQPSFFEMETAGIELPPRANR